MKALLLDGLDGIAADIFEAAGIEVTLAKTIDRPDLLRQIGDYHFLGVRGATKIDRELLDAATTLVAVGRGGAGMNGIDVDYATQRGIVAFNTPGANAESVAECVIGVMLDALHRLHKGSVGMAQHTWLKKQCNGNSLRGRTVGVVGFGYVGKWLARLLEPFGVRLLSYDINPTAELPWVPFVSLPALLAESDVVSLHLPLTSSTRGLVNADFLNRLKPGALLVNFARGELIDEAAVVAALATNQLFGYATDVYPQEPPTAEYYAASPLFSRPEFFADGRLIMTPHLAASSEEAQQTVSEALAKRAVAYLKEGKIPWGANFPIFYLASAADARLIVFHPDEQGMEAAVLGEVKGFANIAASINQRVAPGGIAYTVIDVDGALSRELINRVKHLPGVITVHCA